MRKFDTASSRLTVRLSQITPKRTSRHYAVTWRALGTPRTQSRMTCVAVHGNDGHADPRAPESAGSSSADRPAPSPQNLEQGLAIRQLDVIDPSEEECAPVRVK
jgi:hypothetical protein